MTDLRALETELLTAIAAAADEAALEAVRVAALGRNGSISARVREVSSTYGICRRFTSALASSAPENERL